MKWEEIRWVGFKGDNWIGGVARENGELNDRVVGRGIDLDQSRVERG